MSFLCKCFREQQSIAPVTDTSTLPPPSTTAAPTPSLSNKGNKHSNSSGKALNRVHIDPKGAALGSTNTKAWDDNRSSTSKQRNMYAFLLLLVVLCFMLFQIPNVIDFLSLFAWQIVFGIRR